MNPLKLDDIMKQLLEVLRGSLRKGDIITHYTASQYALLLPLKSYDNGKLVMERVKSAFYPAARQFLRGTQLPAGPHLPRAPAGYGKIKYGL